MDFGPILDLDLYAFVLNRLLEVLEGGKRVDLLQSIHGTIVPLSGCGLI